MTHTANTKAHAAAPRLRAITAPLGSAPTTAARTVPQRVLHQEQLHRVDATQLPQGAGVSLGHCRTDMGLCMGHAACADAHCPRHPNAHDLRGMDDGDHHGPQTPQDRALRAWVWRSYLAGVALAVVVVASVVLK